MRTPAKAEDVAGDRRRRKSSASGTLCSLTVQRLLARLNCEKRRYVKGDWYEIYSECTADERGRRAHDP